MQTPIPYMGNKSAYTTSIDFFVPQKIKTFVEVFAGSAALLFAKEQWAKTEVINDTNGNIVNFFKVLREQPEELKRLISLTPFSREDFYRCKKIVKNGENESDLIRAWAYYIIQSQSVMSCGVAWAGTALVNASSDVVQRKINREELLLQAAKRLKGVVIDRQNYSYILDKYENKETFFFIDPPYLELRSEEKTDKAYSGNTFDENNHIELLEKITKMAGYIIVSGYENSIYNKYLFDWKKIKIKKQVRTPAGYHEIYEVFWINPAAYEEKIKRDKQIKQLAMNI